MASIRVMRPGLHARSSAAGAPVKSRVGDFLRTHWLFTTFFTLGVGLRVITSIAYQPALLYSDTLDYLSMEQSLSPGAWHPIGYSLFLRMILWIPSLAVIPIAQHLLGLATALMVYALLRRFGVWNWAAAVGAAPVLLDPYQLNIEQFILSDCLFEFLIVSAIVTILWHRRPSAWRIGASGLLFAAVAITRFDGIFVAGAALVYLIVRRVGILRMVAFVLVIALPVVAYAGWYDSVHGDFEVSGYTGLFLYGRVAPFANCDGLTLPSYEKVLCPTLPPSKRPGPNWYVSDPSSPAKTMTSHDGLSANQILQNFDKRIIKHQPVTYAHAVTVDFFRSFLPSHSMVPASIDPNVWQFTTAFPVNYVTLQEAQALVAQFGGPQPHVNTTLARFLVRYQKDFYIPGPLLAACALATILAIFGLGKARKSDRRAEAFVLAGSAAVSVLFATATLGFSWRYALVDTVLYPPAAALAVSLMTGRIGDDRRPSGERAKIIGTLKGRPVGGADTEVPAPEPVGQELSPEPSSVPARG